MPGFPAATGSCACAATASETAGVRTADLPLCFDFEFAFAVCITCNSFYRVSHVFSARTNFIVFIAQAMNNML